MKRPSFAAMLALALAAPVASALEFGPATLLPFPQNANGNRSMYAAGIGDLNADGRVDVAYMTTGFSNDNVNDYRIYLYEQQANGTLLQTGNFSFAPAGTPLYSEYMLATADFDHDGRGELVVGASSSVTILRRDAGGTYVPVATLASTFNNIGQSIVRDFDGDGQLDILLFAVGWSSIYRGLGNFSFAAPVQILHAPTEDLVPTDVDGDGRLDLLGTRIEVRQRVEVNYGRPSAFLFSEATSLLERPEWVMRAATAGDVTGDGTPEVLEVHVEQEEYGSTLYLPTTLGVYTRSADGSYHELWTRRLGFDGGWFPGYAIHIRDLDGDGAGDVVAYLNGSLAILRREGGFLGEPLLIPSLSSGSGAPHTWQTAIEDFNGDGCPDIGYTSQVGYAIHYRLDCTAPTISRDGSGKTAPRVRRATERPVR
jgi:hypothetical protein